MTHRYYHTPPQPASNRARCPVCREVTYSTAGIHPQCAVRQSDPPKPKNPPTVIPGTEVNSGDVVLKATE